VRQRQSRRWGQGDGVDQGAAGGLGFCSLQSIRRTLNIKSFFVRIS